MRLDWRIRKGPLNAYASISLSRRVTGVNSTLQDGRHALFWDFDDSGEQEVLEALCGVQEQFYLPDIHLVSTGAPRHWHAYCLEAATRPMALYILASTPGVDRFFQAFGVIRGYWTLRVSPKGRRQLTPWATLEGYSARRPVAWADLKSGVDYWTKML